MPKLSQPLTSTQVERAKYSQNGKNELNDGNGLYLHLIANGSKVWRFRYNQPETGKRTKLTIGNYPAVTLAQARVKREKFLSLLAQEIDPQAYNEQIKLERTQSNSRTLLAIAEQWKDKKQAEIEPKTLDKYWRSLELHIFPFIGAYPIDQIVPTLITPPIKRVEERNNFDMAQRLTNYINDILNFAVNSGLIAFNPCLKVGKVFKRATKQNNPHITSEEIPQLLADIAKANIEPMTRTLIHFQLLTMVRPSEASQAEWAEIDFKKRLWTIPAERMKAREPHAIPLSMQAINLLKQLQPITGRFKYLFPKRGYNNAPMSSASVNAALKRMGYQSKQTAHGLRGLARTYLAEQNITHEHAEACLAHKTGGNVSLAYNHATYLEQRKTIMQLWGDFIERCSTIKTI
ncbi:tyrosine-type recombinase/integrase [Lonepinella sp. MS14435]|uniref:tyrosine-type recombinase/integrase n=1 Tax=Lonepinella sp. MS14435 TaxID=3003618 RepID=UPI0036D776AC